MSQDGDGVTGGTNAAAPEDHYVAPMKFPALWFSQNLVHVVDSLSGVTECTKLGFKSGFYKDLLLVDSKQQEVSSG
jgi:hypothetical protein